MNLFAFFDLDIFAFVILLIIWANEKDNLNTLLFQHKLFMSLVNINLILIIINILGWVFNGKYGQVNFIFNQTANLLLYIMEIVPAALWLIYVEYQISRDEKHIQRLLKPIGIVVFLNAFVSIISLYTGWFFQIDANNIYHRGPYFGIHIFLCFSFLCYSLLLTIINRTRLEKKSYLALLLYFILQIAGSSLQAFIYGISLNWICMAVSLLIIYLRIQDRGLKTDYLTEAFNRRQLDNYIKYKIKRCTKDKTFSAIIIDIDDFKQINDTFGHVVGDEVLIQVVKLLKKSLRHNDFIARYGGDEFCVVTDIYTQDKLQSIVERIKNDVCAFNQQCKKQYKINMSMGYDVYNYESRMNADDYLVHIDKLMYLQKKASKDVPCQ